MSQTTPGGGADEIVYERDDHSAIARWLTRIIRQGRQIEDKLRGVPALHRVWQQVLLCLELVRDYSAGEYRQIAGWAITAIAAGLLYLIDPVELIPDVIPVVGYLDDVAVMLLVLALVRNELQKYRDWRSAREADAGDAPG